MSKQMYFLIKNRLIRTACAVVIGVFFSICNDAIAMRAFNSSVQVDDGSHASIYQMIPQVAADSKGNIFVVWRGGGIYFSKSTNGGVSFEQDIPLGSGDTPVIAVDESDIIYVAWGCYNRDDGSKIYFTKSTDSGTSFTTPVEVSSTSSPLKWNPAITVGTDGTIYIAWQNSDIYSNGISIYFAKSVNGGTSFSADVRVDDNIGDTILTYFPSIGVDQNDVIYVGWADYRRGGNSEMRVSKSVNVGDSFGPSISVNSTIDCGRTSLTIDPNGVVYTAWDGSNGNIYFSKSTDGCASFGQSTIINDNEPGTAQWSSMSMDSAGVIYAIWMRSVNNGYDVCFSKSANSGTSFESNIDMDYDNSTGIDQKFPGMFVDKNGNVYTVWVDLRNSNYGNIYFSSSNPLCPLVSAFLSGSVNNDIIINFGPQYGIWLYANNGTWTQIHTLSPDSILAANLDGDVQGIDELIIDFGSQYGIWIYYNNSTWLQLHSLSSESITLGDVCEGGLEGLIIDFGPQYGIWIYYPETNTWTQIHSLNSESIVVIDADGETILAIDFGDTYGIWLYYDDGSWEQLHSLSPECGVAADINEDGYDEGILDFGDAYGIWIYYPVTDTWSQLHTLSPESIVSGNLDGNGDDLIIDFGDTYGTWIRYDNGTWEQLHNLNPEWMTTGDLDGNGFDEVIIDFGDTYGVWTRYDDGSWEQIHSLSP